jgi:hypothetical protein
MERRTLVARAGSAIYDAMIAFSEANDELTGWEWMRAFSHVQDRFIGLELTREWREEPGGEAAQ